MVIRKLKSSLVVPSPWGEGQGEGERDSLLSSAPQPMALSFKSGFKSVVFQRDFSSDVSFATRASQQENA